MREPGESARSSDDDVPLEEVVFSCSVCQKLISEVYGQVESNQGFHSGTGNEGGMVTKLWIGSCSHVLCGEHLDGGAAPFHPKGQNPQAPCPTCIQMLGDGSPKDLYAIHGLEPDARDATIPASWFDCPPIKLEDTLPGMEALRFQYANLIRYSQGITKQLRLEQRQHQTTKDAYSAERSKRQSRDTELQTLRLEREEFEQTKEKLEKWETRKAAINHNLGLIPDMTREIASLKTQLAALGYRVPDRRYAIESDSSSGSSGQMHTVIEPDDQEHSSSSARKRKYGEAANDANTETHGLQHSAKLRSREMMPPPSLARRQKNDRHHLHIPYINGSSQHNSRPNNEHDYHPQDTLRTYEPTAQSTSRLPPHALPLRPAPSTALSQASPSHDNPPGHYIPFESSARIPGFHDTQLSVRRPQSRALYEPHDHSKAAPPMLYAQQLSEYAPPQDVHGVYEMQTQRDGPRMTSQQYPPPYQDEQFRPASRALLTRTKPSLYSSDAPAVSSISSPFFHRGNSSMGWKPPISQNNVSGPRAPSTQNPWQPPEEIHSARDPLYGQRYTETPSLPVQRPYTPLGQFPRELQHMSPSRNAYAQARDSSIPMTPRQSYQHPGRSESFGNLPQSRQQNPMQRGRITLAPSQSASSLRANGEEHSLSQIRGVKGVGAKQSYLHPQQHSVASFQSSAPRALFSSAGARRIVRR